MELSIYTFAIVCPLVFLAGLVDAIGGGGGLISLPAYLIAGLPPHTAVATNKMSSPFGTALAPSFLEHDNKSRPCAQGRDVAYRCQFVARFAASSRSLTKNRTGLPAR